MLRQWPLDKAPGGEGAAEGAGQEVSAEDWPQPDCTSGSVPEPFLPGTASHGDTV